MKKSELYKMAEIAVINSVSISVKDKLEILRDLMAQEDLALFREPDLLEAAEEDKTGELK